MVHTHHLDNNRHIRAAPVNNANDILERDEDDPELEAAFVKSSQTPGSLKRKVN